MKISSVDKDINSILNSAYYRIPRFQRPYSWDRENIEDFWNDVVTTSEDDYFIGSIVVFDQGKSTFGLVDGQQRLTTITMFLAALRNNLNEQGFDNLAQGIHALIERADIDNEPQYILQTESSFPFLQEYIQKFGDAEIEIEAGQEEKNLERAFAILDSNIKKVIDNVNDDLTIKDDEKKVHLKNKLVEIRDNILELKLIFVELDNEDDAYIIFETLNTRGKDLTVSDLVKNHLTKLLKKKNQNVDIPKEKWAGIRSTIEESQADINTNAFLHHYWLSKHEYTTSKKLFKSIKKQIKKNNAFEFLDALVMDSKTYREINEPSYRKWENEEASISEALNAMLLFRVKQPMPMLLSIMREYKADRLRMKHAKEIFGALENFHFIFTAVTSQRSSGGISFMYAYHARELLNANGYENKIEVIRDLKRKLKEKIPTYEEFHANFEEILFSNEFTKQKKLVQYILAKVFHFHQEGLPLDFYKMSIEHLASQNPRETLFGEEESDKYTAQIGNLIITDKELNSEKLQNKSFKEKKEILLKSGIKVDKIIRDAEEWGEDQIRMRNNYLSELAYNEIWKIK